MRRTEFLYPTGRTPEGMVSVSQIQSWMACGKRWEYGYLEGLSPRVERPYLTVGKLCHRGFEAAMALLWRVRRGEAVGDAGLERLRAEGEAAIREEHARYMEGIEFLREEVPGFTKVREDAVAVFRQALGEFDPARWDVLTVCGDGGEAPALELHFLIPCPGSAGLHGYIDSILRDRESGQAWCTDYKFRRSLQADDDEQFSLQNAVYMRACRLMGVEVTGTMTWQHLNAPAVDPTVTSTGVSRARVRTTWERYRAFVEARGLDPADYAEMEAKLAGLEWFRATKEYRSPETVERIWDEVVVPSSQGIRRSRAGGNVRAMFPWNCRGCPFRDLCQAELRGYDAEYVREARYTRKEHRQ